MDRKVSFKGMMEVFKNSFKGFDENRVMKLSASLAYYTVFSMGPLLIVIISLAGIFLGKEAVEGKIYGQLTGFVGADTAAQLELIIKNASLAGKSKIAGIIGGIALLIGSTTVFAEIQDSINGIWGLRPKPKRGWVKLIQNRFLSFTVIIGIVIYARQVCDLFLHQQKQCRQHLRHSRFIGNTVGLDLLLIAYFILWSRIYQGIRHQIRR